MKTIRCNYCPRPSVVVMSYVGYLAAARNPNIPVKLGTCADHESCVNWKSNLELMRQGRYRNAKLTRFAAQPRPEGE